MKVINKLITCLLLLILVASCKSQNTDSVLGNESMRKEIISSIANDHNMSTEMMSAMMNSEHGKMMMMGNQEMMKMMMENQDMMQKMLQDDSNTMDMMMGTMMNAAKSDSSSMMIMCRKMMDDPAMKGMMDRMMTQGDQAMRHKH